MNSRLRIAIIYGSIRKQRFGDVIGRWLEEQIGGMDHLVVDIIDPRAFGLTINDVANTPSIRRLKTELHAADGFIVLTPEYNHSFPGPLKVLIDCASEEWHAKPVAFVSYGGISGGLRAVEHLRQVFAELHAVTIRDGLSFANAHDRFDEDGSLRDAAGAEQALRTMMSRLVWWAEALKRAKSETPFAQALS